MFKFLRFNFITAEGTYPKFVRAFDTLGSFFGLVALILGVFSLACDQYDIEFELEGQLKEMKDTLEGFYGSTTSFVKYLSMIVKALDFMVTCWNTYHLRALVFWHPFFKQEVGAIQLNQHMSIPHKCPSHINVHREKLCVPQPTVCLSCHGG